MINPFFHKSNYPESLGGTLNTIKMKFACDWCSYYMLIYHLYYKGIFRLWASCKQRYHIAPNSNFVLPRNATGYCSVMWLVLSYHAVVYLVLSDHCLPDPERWRPCNNCCFTWQAFGQLPKALRGMSFYHPYGAAAREERADFRHVKTSSSLRNRLLWFSK